MKFNLTTEAWIPVHTPNGVTHVGIRDALTGAHQMRGIAGDTAWQSIALLRLLIAVTSRAVTTDWVDLWREGRLPTDQIDQYLTDWHHRFWLLDTDAPFMQIPGMEGTVVPASALIPDAALWPSGHDALPLPDAARWLVDAHSYDPSGIKPGTTGDPRVKGGKSYPVSTWLIDRALHTLHGATLAETILLNLPDTPAGTPVWELPPTGLHTDREPTGAADLLTWQARRILLRPDGDQVPAVTVSNGLKLTDETGHLLTLDPMIARRAGKPLRYAPRLYQEAWHRLPILLHPDVIWPAGARLTEHTRAGIIAPDHPVTITILLPHTDTYRAVVHDLHQTGVPVTAGVIADPDRVQQIDDTATACVTAYQMLSENLRKAAGALGAHPDARIDLTVRLSPIIHAALAGSPTWREDLTTETATHGRWLINNAPVAAWVGRVIDGQMYVTAIAEKWFYAALANTSKRISPPERRTARARVAARGKDSIDREVVALEYTRGETLTTLSKRHGVSTTTIREMLTELGVSIRPHGRRSP